MNKQHKKVSRIARTLFVLVFTLLTSVTLVDGQRRKPKAKPVRQPAGTQQVSKPQNFVVASTQISLPELVRRVKPSVVMIRVFDKDGKAVKDGSAFFIAPTRVVTNYHVVEGGSAGEIYSNEGFAYKVSRVLSYDPNADLAILEIELPARVQFKPLIISGGGVQEGESIVVIGNPEGLQGTVSQGIVSAFRQYANESSLIQITAPISAGSSGSPVMNMRGEVVGVAVGAKSDGQNLNFAVSGSKLAAVSENAERWSNVVRLYEDGERLYRGGNYRRALEMFAQVAKLSPAYAAAWMEIGRTQFAIGDYAAAGTAFNETALLEPNNAEAHYNSGIAYAKQGRYADAVNCFRRVIVLYPNSVGTYVETGNAYYELNDMRNAIDSYKQAIRIDPNDASANYNLGLALVAQGNRKSARKQIKKLQELGASEFANRLLQQIPR